MSNLLSLVNERKEVVAEYKDLIAEFEHLDNIVGENGENILLEFISKQHWYGFKNKREIVFDKRTGFLFPNFEFMPHVDYKDWINNKKEYAPNGIGKKLWTSLHEVFFRKDRVSYGYHDVYTIHTLFDESNEDKLIFSFPVKYSGKNKVNIFVCFDHNRDWSYKICNNFNNKEVILEYDDKRDIFDGLKVFPVLKILENNDLLPSNPRLTSLEKAKIILDFFIEKEWIPVFEPDFQKKNLSQWYTDEPWEDEDDYQERILIEQVQCDKVNQIFDAYYQRIQLQKRLVELEQKIAELPEPEPENPFTSDFDYRQEIQNYNVSEINNSVWKYSLAAQQWIKYLLTQIDTWASEHQHLLANALELNAALTKKIPLSLNLNDIEQQLLKQQRTDLQQRLNFSLEPLRSALIELFQQNQTIEETLKHTHSLAGLAELEQLTRPSFTLLAEHTAKLCTQTLKNLEWLEHSLDFVHAIVKSEQQNTEDYLILLDKYQQDLLQIGLDASIESEEIQKWFTEWRQERFQILKQWQPLVDAGFNSVIGEQTVLNTLECLKQYQQSLDQFYLQKRLGIHTTFAFQANGYRQEKLEKEQELIKLNHSFMQNLEKIIFALETSTQKIWLIRFSEIWQQNIVNEITTFLEKEEVLDRSDIAQIMSEEMRKLQQQNLAACLQDAQTYSQALAQREKDTNTLIFKMRKALQKQEV